MMHIFQYALDAVFPPRETAVLLRSYTPDTFLHHYQPSFQYHSVVLSHYRHPPIHAAITECKFYRNHHATVLLAALVRHWLMAHVTESTLIIPIPLSQERQRERGYNQVERVIYRASENLPHIQISTTALRRVRDTQPQTNFGRKERLTNVRDAFGMQHPIASPIHTASHIILCDDVLTTGATLAAACATLRPHLTEGARITQLVWAH